MDRNETTFACTAIRVVRDLPAAAARWLDRVDPGVHRRIKGLRLITAYGIAAMFGAMGDITRGMPDGASLTALAGGFALWGSVSEGRGTRPESSRDLVLLSFAAAVGAASFIVLAPLLLHLARVGPELVLVSGAFCVGYLRRFGLTGTGIGSQIYIGQLLAYGADLGHADLPAVAAAGAIAAVASVVPRLLSGPAEHPPPLAAPSVLHPGMLRPELAMGIQAATGALLIVLLNATIGLIQSAWAITACTYVIAGSATGTIDRVRRRIIGTAIGVPLGLLFLPLAGAMPFVAWAAAASAMVIYAMALPERYDIACGAFAFTLIVTLAVAGEHSVPVLAARGWETLLGGALGLAAATLLFPLRVSAPAAPSQPHAPEPADQARRTRS
ncbi:MAG: FUSC family protein [Acetobacteraceae bacterium]